MDKLRFWHYGGYGLGDLAGGLTFGLSSAFLLPFYTDVLGISAATAGTLFLAARLWDGINDPLMGTLADRVFRRREARKKEADKFRPYLLAGSLPLALMTVILFLVPQRLSGNHRLFWAYAVYITWGMTYTFINIPYGSLASVMTRSPVERSVLSVARGIGSMGGIVLPRIILPLLLTGQLSGEAAGYRKGAVIIALSALFLYLVAYLTTRENPLCRSVVPTREKARPKLIKNRPFIALSLASLFMLMGLTVNGTINLYYFRENLEALELMAYAGAAAILPAAGAALLIPNLVKRYGAARTSASASLLSALCWTALFLLPSRAHLYLAGGLAAYLFLMIPNMTVWAMVSDCIDHQETLTGTRREGAVYGTYSFVRKAGQAAAGFLSGAGLALAGYRSGGAIQSLRTLEWIKFLTLGIPGLCLFAAWLSYRFIWKIPPEENHA